MGLYTSSTIISAKIPVTLQKIDSVPPGQAIGNVKNLVHDTLTETAGTPVGTHGTTWIVYWNLPLPNGLIFDLGKEMNVGQVDMRNGYAKGWAHGTKDFDISL